MSDDPIRRQPARCELPGCDAIVEAHTAGAKRQRYCSAAHRVSARQQRRAERIATQADRAADSVQEPVEIIGAIAAGHSAPPASSRGSMDVTPLRRPANASIAIAQQPSKSANRRTALRRRAIAVLGVASVLAAGQQVAGMDRNTAPNPPAGLTTAGPAEPDVRVDRAALERGLVMVNAQLDMITQAMDQWRLLHGPSTPPQVDALMERQRVVEELKATVVSKLTAMDTIERAAADRTAAEQALAAIDHALNTTPTPGSPQEADTVRQLTDQRKMWTQRRDQITAANAAAQRAVAEPMPDVSDHTSPLAQQVVAITRQPAPAPAPADRKRGALVAVAPREHAAEERPPVYTSAPPRPTTFEPDAPPSRDALAGGHGQGRAAVGDARTSPPPPSGDRSAAPSRAELAAADEALNTAAGWAPAAGDVMPAYVDHAATRPGPGDRHPTESGSSGPHTGGQGLPRWAQDARTHMNEDMAQMDHGSGARPRRA